MIGIHHQQPNPSSKYAKFAEVCFFNSSKKLLTAIDELILIRVGGSSTWLDQLTC